MEATLTMIVLARKQEKLKFNSCI